MKGFIMLICCGLLILFFCRLLSYFSLKTAFEQIPEQKQRDLKENIGKTQEAIKIELRQKYQADIMNYDAMAQRLEMEKAKVKEIENKRKIN